MKILVCGGRDFNDPWKFRRTMLQYLKKVTLIIEGGAKGADTMALEWSMEHNIDCDIYHAEWKKYGKAAGHIRNQRMLDEGQPDLVVAFKGGAGTADMVRRAKAAGVEVVETWLT